MNRPLRRVAIFCLLLFAALMINANYIQIVKASSYTSHPDNRRNLLNDYSYQRGPILVDNKPVAQSVPSSGDLKYQRQYPQGSLYSQITGYASINFGKTGIEYYENSILNGTSDKLFIRNLLDLFNGKQKQGGSVELTLNAKAQQAAAAGLQGREGSVVALDPTTGAILALYSNPTFDPSPLASHDGTVESQAANALDKDPAKPLLDHAIGETYPPGSIFKIVTSAAALQNGFNSTDTIPAPSDQLTFTDAPNNPLGNENGEICGDTSMTVGLERSCNTVYGYLGLQVGPQKLAAEASEFGINSSYKVPMSTAQSVFPTSIPASAQSLVAKSAIGQQDVRITPLQAAMLAATVANKGQAMMPYLVAAELGPNGQTVSTAKPQALPGPPAMSASTAQELTQMMVGVVDNGTGTNAQIDGVKVAGKTGTAQRGAGQNPLAWFVSFAPADNPKVAVAVLVQDDQANAQDISGGGFAAPIAKSVMEAVMGQ